MSEYEKRLSIKSDVYENNSVRAFIHCLVVDLNNMEVLSKCHVLW